MKTTIKQNEINQFQKDSHAWWDEEGAFAPLHALNPVRMKFMRQVLDEYVVAHRHPGESRGPNKKNKVDSGWNLASGSPSAKPGGRNDGSLALKGVTHLDIGCGGGLVAEPFARLGATVTGLDADAQAIDVARNHARESGLEITYHALSIEEFRNKNKILQFDTITALEIIEHVEAPELFLAEAVAALKPGGVLFVSTLNRTVKSFALGIIAAEYVLGWVPKGTHNWKQFIRPSTLTRCLRALNLEPVAASGITYHPVKREFTLNPYDLSVNYIMAFKKSA